MELKNCPVRLIISQCLRIVFFCTVLKVMAELTYATQSRSVKHSGFIFQYGL